VPLLLDASKHKPAHGEILPALPLSSYQSRGASKIDNAETPRKTAARGSWAFMGIGAGKRAITQMM
jgi:hypothetical protein